MDAGRRPHRIGFHQVTVSTDGGGIERESVSAAPLARAWARVFWGSGAERRDAAAAGSVQAATFNVLDCAAVRRIGVRDVIRFDGADWGISAITVPAIGEREFIATRLRG